MTTNTPAPADLVEHICRAQAKADGLDWDEVCGCDTEAGDCDSSTCMAAWDEDHDAALSRRHYRKRTQAAIAAYQAHMASNGVVQADRDCAAELIVSDHITRLILAGEMDHHPYVQHVAAHRRAVAGGKGDGFQSGVGDWMMACFGPEIAADRLERADRFTEEALELAQTMPGFTADRAHALVDYVFGRPIGERHQEVGGVMVTLAALCNSFDLSINTEADRGLARVWTKVEAIRAKQKTKPVGSALPVAVTPQPDPRDAAKFQLGDRVEKVSGSSWRGHVVGTYSTALTPEGYAVESETEVGSVQIYPAKALRTALANSEGK